MERATHIVVFLVSFGAASLRAQIRVSPSNYGTTGIDRSSTEYELGQRSRFHSPATSFQVAPWDCYCARIIGAHIIIFWVCILGRRRDPSDPSRSLLLPTRPSVLFSLFYILSRPHQLRRLPALPSSFAPLGFTFFILLRLALLQPLFQSFSSSTTHSFSSLPFPRRGSAPTTFPYHTFLHFVSVHISFPLLVVVIPRGITTPPPRPRPASASRNPTNHFISFRQLRILAAVVSPRERERD